MLQEYLSQSLMLLDEASFYMGCVGGYGGYGGWLATLPYLTHCMQDCLTGT